MWYNTVMDFEGQRDGEEVVCVFRRHIVTAIKGLFFLIAMVLIGFLPMIMWPGDGRMVIVWIVFIGLQLCFMAF